MTDDLKLIRHTLGSIDLSEVEDEKEMSEAERQAYVASIHAVWPRLSRDIRRFMLHQLMFNSKEAETWEQVLFGRGVLDGMAQVYNHWQIAHLEHQEINKTDDGFDKHSVVGEI